MDPFWLNEISAEFSSVITGGYLRVHPWVTTLLATMLTLGIFAGVAVAAMASFHPRVLIELGTVILRGAVIWAVGMNWNAIFDGFMNSVVSLGLVIGGSTIGPAELLSPGTIWLLGIRASTNLYLIVMNLADDIWYGPLLFLAYTGVWIIMLIVFGVLSLALMTAKVEFQFISVYAFLMWPLMPVWFVAWIADSLVRLLIAAALRLGGLAGLYSIVLPFVGESALPSGEPTVQGAVSMGLGMIILGYFVWHGPRMLGGSAWPGSGLITLGALTWAGLSRGRRAAAQVFS